MKSFVMKVRMQIARAPLTPKSTGCVNEIRTQEQCQTGARDEEQWHAER